MRQGIERIQRRIAEVEAFDPKSVKERWPPEVRAIEVAIDETLSRVFGNGPRYDRYASAAIFDRGPLIMGGGPDPLHKIHEWLADGKANSLALLKQAVSALGEDLAEFPQGDESETFTTSVNQTNEIFIVHGHDSPAKVEVARLIERAGLKAVILHEQPNSGRTIIEKFEDHGAPSDSPWLC
jgi:hypothetical protein